MAEKQASFKKLEDDEEVAPTSKCGKCCSFLKSPKGRMCMLGTFGVIVVIWVLLWIWQGASYGWASLGCGQRKMQGHRFIDGEPSGCPTDAIVDPKVCQFDDAYNMIGKEYIMMEKDADPNNRVYEVYAQETNGNRGAYGGQWKRYWGPLYWTYVLKDQNAVSIAYMRPNLAQFQYTYRIGRCDAKEPTVTYAEGGNWFANWWNGLPFVAAVLGQTPPQHYNVWVGDDLAGLAEVIVDPRSSHVPSITFQNANNSQKGMDKLSSSVMQMNHWAKKAKEEWQVTNSGFTSIPYYATSAMTVLAAFDTQAWQNDAPEKAERGKPTLVAEAPAKDLPLPTKQEPAIMDKPQPVAEAPAKDLPFPTKQEPAIMP